MEKTKDCICKMIEETEDPTLLCILHTFLGSIKGGPQVLGMFAKHCAVFAFEMREQIMKELGENEIKH